MHSFNNYKTLNDFVLFCIFINNIKNFLFLFCSSQEIILLQVPLSIYIIQSGVHQEKLLVEVILLPQRHLDLYPILVHVLVHRL